MNIPSLDFGLGEDIEAMLAEIAQFEGLCREELERRNAH